MNTEQLYNFLKDNFKYSNGELIWNNDSRYQGKPIYSRMNKCGHLKVKIRGRNYFYHRMIFLYHNGYLPKMIDHIDTNKINNRITNLRHSSSKLNSLNMRRIQETDTNFIGVNYVPEHNKTNPYRARIKHNGVDIHLGYFSDMKSAKDARKQAHREIFNIALSEVQFDIDRSAKLA